MRARVSATGAVHRNVLKAGRRSPLAYTAPVVLAERSSSSGSRAFNGGGIGLLAAAAAVVGDPRAKLYCIERRAFPEGQLAMQVLCVCTEAPGEGE